MKDRLFLLRERFFNVLLALFYGSLIYSHAIYFLDTFSLTTLLFIVYETLIFVLVLARNFPKEVSFNFKAWLAAAVGTWLPLFFVSNKGEFFGEEIFLFLQLVGVVISMVAMFNLSLSFGIVPANRGIKKSGLYKFVRHPIYAGYFLSLTCFVIQNAPDQESLIRNSTILVIALIALVFRIKYEEEFLSKDAAYRKFIKTTPYRLFPKIW